MKSSLLSAVILLAFIGVSFAVNIENCQKLTGAGETYLLTKDITGASSTCMVIEADDITLDCQGHWINGTGESYTQGVLNEGHDRVIVKDCKVSNFESGFYWKEGAGNGKFLNNLAQNNNYQGIELEFNCSNNELIENTVLNNGVGVAIMYGSNKNKLIRNTASENGDSGIYTASSSENSLIENHGSGNAFGVYLDSPSDNNVVTGNTFSNGDAGLVISGADNNQVSGNDFSNHERGIVIEWGSHDNQLSGNTASSNSENGIFFQENGSNNTIVGNTFLNNYVDVYFDSGSSGNSGSNTCNTINDPSSNSITCTGGAGQTNGTGSSGTGTVEDEETQTGKLPCCPAAILVFTALGLFVLRN